jgi:hypothetical protein
VDQNIVAQNARNERQIAVVIESYEAKLKKLGRRQDPAASFARAEIKARIDDARRILKAHRSAVSEHEATISAFDAARFGLEQKRAELMAEVEKQLAPLVQRQHETAQVYEATARRAVLGHVSPPYVGGDPGATIRIAELSRQPAPAFGTSNNHIDLVLEQRKISAYEMACAIVAEADVDRQADPRMALDLMAMQKSKLIEESFALRWRMWATANGIDLGPALQPAAAAP